MLQRINSLPLAKHLYEVGVHIIDPVTQELIIKKVEVEANTSSQASSIAKKSGCVVRDVNMVG